MKNRLTAIGIVCLIVTAGALVFITFEPEVVSASGTTRYVGSGPGNYSTIQDAINDSSDGDTVFVYSGTYYENVTVNKTINLTGENRETTMINGGGSGDINVVYVTADWVNITGFTITGSGPFHPNAGINLDQTQNCCLYDNIISNNQFHGIYFYSSSNNIIMDNNISSNDQSGIRLETSSNDNIITGNNLLNNDIDLISSYNNNISHNNLSSDSKISLGWGSNWNIVTGNNFTNKWACINIDTSHNNNITDNYFSTEMGSGIGCTQSSNNNIIGNDFFGNSNRAGIILLSSSDINITNNNFFNSGIFIYSGSKSQHFDSHTIPTSNMVNGKPLLYIKNSNGIPPIDGIQIGQLILANCTNIEVRNLQINDTYAGIEIAYSSDININNSKISNSEYGFYLWSSSNNNITNNTVSSNCFYGIHLYQCSNNRIYHNNIVKNAIQACDDTNNGNKWDNGYPSGGNFWSDYDGIDLNSTPAQDVPPPDGIGDTSYEIDSNSPDNYPLMKPVGNYLFLYEGWNLISIPFIQIDQDLGTVLKSIEGLYDTVWWYNTSDNSDHWKVNNTSKPPFKNDLGHVNHTMGFWIHITEPGGVLFEYFGTQLSINQTIALSPGWNLVGYPSLSDRIRTAALNNITFSVDVDSIWSYNAVTQKWGEIGNSDYFVVGRGYWIHALGRKVWDVPL